MQHIEQHGIIMNCLMKLSGKTGHRECPVALMSRTRELTLKERIIPLISPTAT